MCLQNSGLWQGRMVKRGKIPKNDLGECWHWKDLDVGKDICIYGKVFHTVSCDLFTKVSVILSMILRIYKYLFMYSNIVANNIQG